jgi:lysophospholipase L1-like esterase
MTPFFALAIAPLMVWGFLPIRDNHRALNADQRIVQDFLADQRVPLKFRCDRLYEMNPGEYVLAEWPRVTGDFPFDDLFGNRTTYRMDDGLRRVTGLAPYANAKRVVVIGESSTFGFGLSDEHTLPSILQVELGQGFAVVNLAYPGMDVSDFLKPDAWSRVEEQSPDVLVAAFSQNGLRNHMTARRCQDPRAIPLLSFPPTNPWALAEAAFALRDAFKRRALGKNVLPPEAVAPTRYTANLHELIERAETLGAQVVLLEHDIIFAKPEDLPGFAEVRDYQKSLAEVSTVTRTKLVRMADGYATLSPSDRFPGGTPLADLRERGVDSKTISRLFLPESAFIDVIHPSPAMNRALAVRLAPVVRAAGDTI